MERITEAIKLNSLESNNKFIGTLPEMRNTTITFNGEGNILYCEEGVILVDSVINFNGDNSIIYLCKNKHWYRISVSANLNNVFYCGRNNYMNGRLNVILSEQKHCFIGNNGLFSFDIWIRNADPHLVYSCESGKRINPTKSVFLGDHVWLGQSAMVLKGSQIDSGSIIGAMSLVAGKKIGHNESWGGVPAHKITDGVFWESSCVHKWDDEMTANGMLFENIVKNKKGVKPDSYIYKYNQKQEISFDDIDKALSVKNIDEKIKYLDEITNNKNKNRFVHNIQNKKKKSLFKRH